MAYLNSFIYALSLVVFIFLALQALYLLIFGLAGRLFPSEIYPVAPELGRFVIYIPSYKEDSVIVNTALAALGLDYPMDKRHVVIIADSLAPETLLKLRELPIQVVEVSFDKSTKARALNVAVNQTRGEFDYALVLDADNVCATDFLYRMNDALKSGYKVVQGQRVAKNTNTRIALLDAISEGINNNLFRKGHAALGLSCAIIGSGMALDFRLFKQIMPEITAIGGFDKEMELRLLRSRVRFGYAERALVYDEKTTQKTAFENQRRRWMSAQVHYMQRYLGEGFRQLFKGNIDFFDKVFQTLLLPRILLLGIMPVALVLSLVHIPAVPPAYWCFIGISTYLAILLSVPVQYFNKRLGSVALALPAAFFSMFKLLFKLKGANKTFIHTPHGHTK